MKANLLEQEQKLKQEKATNTTTSVNQLDPASLMKEEEGRLWDNLDRFRRDSVAGHSEDSNVKEQAEEADGFTIETVESVETSDNVFKENESESKPKQNQEVVDVPGASFLNYYHCYYSREI